MKYKKLKTTINHYEKQNFTITRLLCVGRIVQ